MRRLERTGHCRTILSHILNNVFRYPARLHGMKQLVCSHCQLLFMSLDGHRYMDINGSSFLVADVLDCFRGQPRERRLNYRLHKFDLTSRYGTKEISCVDILPNRVAFAKQYCADKAALTPERKEWENGIEWAKRGARILVEQFGMRNGADVCALKHPEQRSVVIWQSLRVAREALYCKSV